MSKFVNKVVIGIALFFSFLTFPLSSVFASTVIDLKNYFSFNGNAVQLESHKNTARLTEARPGKSGSIAGIQSIDMSKDFHLSMDVNLGSNVNGADGIGLAFHQDSIGSIGDKGGGLGIRNLKKGIGFEIDTYPFAPDDNDPSFNHSSMKKPHAGFVSTDYNSSVLTALAPMQYIQFEPNAFKPLTLHWDSGKKLFTVNYDGKNWSLNGTSVELDKKYTFTIGASTGSYYNEHYIRLNEIKGQFIKPNLSANDIEITAGEAFDPFDKRIGLKAWDEIDGDLTNQIKVVENKVDASKPGVYNVTYEVKNSSLEIARKTIKVTVVKKEETWPNGSPAGWKAFSGEDLTLIKDPNNALFGEYIFYSDAHASIYKQFVGEESLSAGKYNVTVYAKPLALEAGTLPLKVSLKKNPSSGESRDLINKVLNTGKLVEKGYYELTADFNVAPEENTPLINVENYQGGYIAGIFIRPLESKNR